MVIGPSGGYANTSGSVTHTPSLRCQDSFSGSSAQPWCLKLLNGERIKSLGHAKALSEVAVISIISRQRDTYWAEHQQLPLWSCRYNVSEPFAKLNLLPHVSKHHAVVYSNISGDL